MEEALKHSADKAQGGISFAHFEWYGGLFSQRQVVLPPGKGRGCTSADQPRRTTASGLPPAELGPVFCEGMAPEPTMLKCSLPRTCRSWPLAVRQKAHTGGQIDGNS